MAPYSHRSTTQVVLDRFFDFLSGAQFKQVVCILGILATSALFGVLYGKSRITFAILVGAAALGGLGAFVLQKKIHLSPVIILLSALFAPFTLPTGTSSRVAVSMVLTGFFLVIWIIRILLVERSLRLLAFPGSKFLLGFTVITVISLFWGNIFRDNIVRIWDSYLFVQLASAAVMILLPVALWITAKFLDRESTLRWMAYTFILAAGLNLARRLLNINLPVNGEGLFAMWAMALCAGLILYDKTIKKWQIIFLSVLLAGLVYWSFIRNTDWLAGWLPGLFSLGILVILRSKKLTLAMGVLVIIYVIIKQDYFLSFLTEEQDVSGVTRVAAWLHNLQFTGKHLLLGMGPAGYAAYYMTYSPSSAMATHSNYLDILSETGITGFVCFLGFFISMGLYGYRLCKRLKPRDDFLSAMAHIAFAGTMGCILIMAFGDWLIPFAYTQSIAGFSYEVYSWIFIGTLPVIDQLARANPIQAPLNV